MDLVALARSYAADELGLHTGETFVDVDLTDEPMERCTLYVSRKDSISSAFLDGRAFASDSSMDCARELEKEATENGHHAYLTRVLAHAGHFPITRRVLKLEPHRVLETFFHEGYHNHLRDVERGKLAHPLEEAIATYTGFRVASDFCAQQLPEYAERCIQAMEDWYTFADCINDIGRAIAAGYDSEADSEEIRASLSSRLKELNEKLLNTNFSSREPLNNGQILRDLIYSWYSNLVQERLNGETFPMLFANSTDSNHIHKELQLLTHHQKYQQPYGMLLPVKI